METFPTPEKLLASAWVGTSISKHPDTQNPEDNWQDYDNSSHGSPDEQSFTPSSPQQHPPPSEPQSSSRYSSPPLSTDSKELFPISADQLYNSSPAFTCLHTPQVNKCCELCEQVISPPRIRSKGLQKPLQQGVGSGHGNKVSSWCSTRQDTDSVIENIRENNEMDRDYKPRRIRKDRRQREPPEKRHTRLSSLRNSK